MAKRFSLREFGLLMAPVWVVGATGCASMQPKSVAAKKPYLSFRLDKPTALQAFRGADAAFVVTYKNLPSGYYSSGSISPYVGVKTARGIEIGKKYGNLNPKWNQKLWHQGYFDQFDQNPDSEAFALDTRVIPAGETYIGAFGAITSFMRNHKGAKALPLKGQWKIDRTQIKPLNLQSWPRQPLVTLREVKVLTRYSRKIEGEAIFQLEGASMDDKTSALFELTDVADERSFFSIAYKPILKKPRRRRVIWDVAVPRVNTHRISGRVSADNRWPLGFEIEPFDFKSAKVGQKLKFKQGPVALPKP